MTCTMKIKPQRLSYLLRGLEMRERAVLVSMLSHMWSNEGHVANDERMNALVCGVRPSSYRKAMSVLLSQGIFDIIAGRVYLGSKALGIVSRVAITNEVRQRTLQTSARCTYCGDTAGPLEVDHIYPAALGGTNHRDNLVVACLACNRLKRDMSPEEWGEIVNGQG